MFSRCILKDYSGTLRRAPKLGLIRGKNNGVYSRSIVFSPRIAISIWQRDEKTFHRNDMLIVGKLDRLTRSVWHLSHG
jgi:hypothetical protein